MDIVQTSKLKKEEEIVAELSLLGITYLSRLRDDLVPQSRTEWALLADLMRQPSSRVRSAVIALLLEHPEYAKQMPLAIKKLHTSNRMSLKLFYTAAVYLQRLYVQDLKDLQGERFMWLPDFYSSELGIQPELDAIQSLRQLGKCHQSLTGCYLNWTGSYQNVAAQWLRRKKLDIAWNQSAR